MSEAGKVPVGTEDVVDEVEVDEGADAGDQHEDADSTDEQGADDSDPVDRGEDDASGEDEGQAGLASQVARRRPNDIIREAKNAAREARERADATAREVAELRAQLAGRQTVDQQREETERVAVMTDSERFDYYRQKDRAELGREIGTLKFQLGDTADRTAFENLCARTPALSAIRDEVEARLAAERRNGINVPRETVAKFLRGERALQRASGAKTRQAKNGAVRIEREKGRPSNSRGDVQRTEARGGDDKQKRYDRLKDLSI